MNCPSPLVVPLLALGGLLALEITVSPAIAEGCSGKGSGPSGHGGQGPCEQEVIVDIEPLYTFIPSDGVLLYREIRGKVACEQAPGAPSLRVLGPDGTEVSRDLTSPSPYPPKLAWKPAAPLQPDQSYRMVVQGVPGAPVEHTFQTGGPAPAPTAVLQIKKAPPSSISGDMLLTCEWPHTFGPGDCINGPHRSSSPVSSKERVTLEATWSPPPSFPEVYEHRLRWDEQPPEAVGPPDHSRIYQVVTDGSLPGKCLSLQVRNPVTGAESASEPQCVTLPALKPDALDCAMLATAIEQCGQAGAPVANGSHFGSGHVVSDISGLTAQCSAGSASAGGAVGAPSSGGGCAQGPRGQEGWWLLALGLALGGVGKTRKRGRR